MNTNDLIDKLSSDLKPVGRPPALWLQLVAWLVVSVAGVAAISLLLGPWRPGAFDQLLGTPRFTVEVLTGLLALIGLSLSALLDSVPGRASRRLRLAGWVLFGVWIGGFLVGLAEPVFEPSMAGKRAHCTLEAYLMSILPVLALVWLQNRRFPLDRVRAVAHAAAAGAMIPALLMQFACMYDARHILEFHVAPIGVVTAVAVAFTMLVRKVRAGP